MSVVKDLILQADDELRYPTSGELRSMEAFLNDGDRRVRVARVLTENERKIVDESAKQLSAANPTMWPLAAMPTAKSSAPSACAISAGTCAW